MRQKIRRFDLLTAQILEQLSENSRLSFVELAKKANCSPKTVQRRLKFLEKEFGLKYVLELNEKELGQLTGIFVKVKFKQKPPEKILLNYLKKFEVPQFAALTTGDFDLVIYAVAADLSEFSNWANWFRQKLNQYIQEWGTSTVVGTWFGFFPLNEKIISKLNLEAPKKTILKLLNENSRMPLKEIVARTNIPKSTAYYYLSQILKSKFISRCTIIMQTPPKEAHSISLLTYRITDNFMKANVAARNLIISEGSSEESHKTILVVNTTGSFDDLLLCSFNELNSCHRFQERINRTMKNVILSSESALIMSILLGNLPYRKLDVKKHYRADWGIYEYLKK